MKFRCECGNIIADHGPAHYKAEFISDQDNDDLMEEIEVNIKKMITALNDGEKLKEWRENFFGEEYPQNDTPEELLNWIIAALFAIYSRTMYQCEECGRLYIYDQNDKLNCYKPETESEPRNILSS